MADELTPTHLTVRLLRLPTRRGLAAAHDPGPESGRLLTIVCAHRADDRSAVTGWGECSALNRAGYTSESAQGAYELLSSGGPIDPRSDPMAAAAVDMALLDVQLRAEQRSLADHLGTTGQSAPAGAVVGLGTDIETVERVAALVAQGYGRVKLKIVPGRVVGPVRAVRRDFTDLEIQVDANASLGTDDLDDLRALESLDVRVVEQPFAAEDHATAAQLIASTNLVVIADEAVTGASSVEGLVADRAALGIVVKPPKLGGLTAALATLDQAARHSLAASLGGVLESALGRHVLAAMAPLPAFTITGDLSPAGQWLADDPFPDLVLRNGCVAAPSHVGIAPDPDRELLARHTVAVETTTIPQVLHR